MPKVNIKTIRIIRNIRKAIKSIIYFYICLKCVSSESINILIDHLYFFKCKFPFFYVVVFVMIHNILLCIYK